MHRTTGDNYTLDSNGNRVFTAGPPPTTLDEGWANAVQEEIANAIEASGQTLAESPASDLMNQLATAIQRAAAYDSIVFSQETFNAIWERTGANAYKIKDGIGAVYFKAYTGGYNMSGPSSPLSDGDTWGAFSTNEATFIMCDGGNYFQMGDTPSYWNISTSNTVVYNMDVRGIGSSAATITKSIYIPAAVENCRLLYPSVHNRKTSAAASSCIEDASGTALCFGGYIHNCTGSSDAQSGFNAITVIGGIVDGLTTSGLQLFCFLNCPKVVNGYADATTGGNGTYVFYGCDNLSGCNIGSIINSGASAVAFRSCTNISSSSVSNISSTGSLHGFYRCENITGCKVYSISSKDDAYGYRESNKISGCTAISISSSTDYAYGFYDCDNVSGCQAKTIKYTGTSSSYSARGFSDCNRLSACTADTIAASAANAYAYGFHNCDNLSACYSTTVTAVTALHAFGFCDCQRVSASSSVSADDYGFYNCDEVDDSCTATGSTTNFFDTECWAKKTITGIVSNPAAGPITYAHGIPNLKTNNRMRQLTAWFVSASDGTCIAISGPGNDANYPLLHWTDTNFEVYWSEITRDTNTDAVYFIVQYQKS